jgi:hypothetical protein
MRWKEGRSQFSSVVHACVENITIGYYCSLILDISVIEWHRRPSHLQDCHDGMKVQNACRLGIVAFSSHHPVHHTQQPISQAESDLLYHIHQLFIQILRIQTKNRHSQEDKIRLSQSLIEA